MQGFPTNAVVGCVPDAATVRAAGEAPSLGVTGRAQRLWRTPWYLDHEGEMPGGSWGVIPLPQAGRADVVNLTQPEPAGQAGTFLRRLAQGVGIR